MIDSEKSGAPTELPAKHHTYARPISGPLWFGPALMLGTFLLVFALTLWVSHQKRYRVKQRDLSLQAESLGESLRLRLKGNADYLAMLALERGNGELSAALFRQQAGQYVTYHPELSNITWVDAGYAIREVAPLANNDQVIGLKLDLPEPKRASRLARELRRPIYTRPFAAPRGGSSFEVWVPVFRGETFLGLFGGVYSCDKLLDPLVSAEQRRLYHLSLWDAGGGVLGELPVSGSPDRETGHTVPVTPSGSGVFLHSQGYRQDGQDWPLTVLELVSLALVFAMAYTLWELKLEIEERRRAEEAVNEQAMMLELEIEERQVAQENLQEQTALLEEEIGDRRHAEEALIASEEQLRLILDSTGEAIYGIDLEGRCTFCNAACVTMLGYSHPDELLWNNMHLQIHHSHLDGSYLPQEKCRVHQGMKKGAGAHADDEVFWRTDGTCFAVEYRSYPQYRGGKVVGAVVTFTNITERRQLEEQFRQAQKMESIGRLAGGVAHDFNNMLSVILGAAELSRCQAGGNESLSQYLDLISKAATRSSEITRQLLAFSRKEVISPKQVNLNAQIVESEKMLSRLISEDVKLSFRPFPELWAVLIDPSQADQILMNLSVNAYDAMPDGGSLTIETANVQINDNHGHFHPNAKPGDYVVLTVSDTGIGMDRATREHIFEPFFTTKGVGQGTGLGLATVYGIVTQNNGFINVYSEPGHGSVFKIFLPRLIEQVAAEDNGGVATGSVSGTIVLVEDEEMLLWMATKLLEEIGYQVIQAKSPQEAIAICEREGAAVDLVLTDVVMPGMNGREMVERIRAVRPQMKVIFMSGYTADIVAQRGIVDEGMHYIQKPLVMGKLGDKIRLVLAEG